MSVNRRTVLGASAAAVTASATGAFGARSEGVSSDDQKNLTLSGRTVALEEHFFVPKLIASNPATKAVAKSSAKFLPQSVFDELADLGSHRLEEMDKHGITLQVISAAAPGADLIDGLEGVQFARATNNYLADAVRRHPQRYAGFAHLPMRIPDAAADELERAVTQLGFRGALINGTTEGRFLDDARFRPVLERAVKLDVPIYLHPNFVPPAIFEAYYADLPGKAGPMLAAGGFGWHAEVAVHVFRMALAGTFEQHPGLKLIVGHMGETLPFMLDRMDHVAIDMAGYKEPVSPIIRERVFLTTSGVFSTPAFLCALTSFGADQILFSVDYPYSKTALAMDWIDHIPVSPADRAKIMHGNADRLLKLT